MMTDEPAEEAAMTQRDFRCATVEGPIDSRPAAISLALSAPYGSSALLIRAHSRGLPGSLRSRSSSGGQAEAERDAGKAEGGADEVGGV